MLRFFLVLHDASGKLIQISVVFLFDHSPWCWNQIRNNCAIRVY